MAVDNKPAAGYSLVPGDGGRASGLVRRRIAEEGGGSGGGGEFLDLSLGSIYNNHPSSVAHDGGFSPVERASLPAAAAAPLAADASAVAAATAHYAPPAPASLAPAFALGLAAASAVPGDGNGPAGPVFFLAGNALAAAANQQGQLAPASFVLPPLFISDGIVSVPVPVPMPVHGNAVASAAVPSAATDRGATPPAPRSNSAVALQGATPPPSNAKPPRGRGSKRRRRSGAAAAGDDAGAGADALAPTTGDDTAPPPFPWATKTSGAHPTLAELTERGIHSIDGDVRCKRCDAGKTISYEIRAKFEELSRFIARNVEAMHDRAPPEWMCPALADCDKCGQRGSLRPVIAAQKWRINWMFLLLGQTLGLCTLEQLKHFCARTRQHRTGAKDRVLYSTYMELCNQLCPGGPFDMASHRKNRTRPFA